MALRAEALELAGHLAFRKREWKRARVRLEDVVVAHNHAGGDGGGVSVKDGAGLTITGSIFRDNTADGSGGGVSFSATSQAAQVRIDTTTFDTNRTGTSSTSDGGGIRIEAMPMSSTAQPPRVDVTVQATRFIDNTTGNDGGGMWNSDVTRLTIEQVYATGNTAVEDSGALGLSAMHLNSASFSLTDSYLASNRTTGPGSMTTPDAGGVCFDFQAMGAATPTGHVQAVVAGNIFLDNSASGAGGGLYVRDNATQTTFDARITDNAFIRNQATLSNIASRENGAGGGTYVDGSAATNRLTLSNNRFVGNTAATNGGGAYLEIDSGTADVARNDFRANHAVNGGGLYLAGSADGTMGGTVNLAHDRFHDNTASNDGGAVFIAPPITASLDRDTITRNQAGSAGGGVDNDGGHVTIRNSTIRDNTAPSGPNVFGAFTNGGSNRDDSGDADRYSWGDDD